MNTFSKMWGIKTPAEAKAKIDEQRSQITGEPRNLEEQAISLVGQDIYQKLIKGYTEKQWEETAKNYRPSLLSVCLSDIRMTTIILMTVIRVSPREDTMF